MPGGQPGKKRSPLVPILVVLVLAAAGLGAFFLLSGDDEGGGPEGVATRYFNAVVDGDCNAMLDTIELGGQSREQALAECQAFVGSADLRGGDLEDEVAAAMPTELVSATVASETESQATVTVEYRTQAGSTDTEEVHLVNGDQGWRVDLEGSGGSVPGPSDPEGEPSPPDDGEDDPGSGSGSGGGTAPPIDSEEAQGDPALVGLANACAGGDMVSCDDLFWGTDAGGELEAYAMTCGGLAPGGDVRGDCDELYG